MAEAGEKIVLGSGKIFVTEYTGTMPDDATIEADSNLLGLIQGGASLEYKPEFYTAEDDAGRASKTITTKEESSLKTGIATWCGNTLQKICATAKVTEDGAQGKRTVKIGGVGNQNNKKYVIRFLHEDNVDGDIRVTIIGSNQSGFNLAFAKDKETVIEVEFKATPQDSDGTLIIYEEEIPTT